MIAIKHVTKVPAQHNVHGLHFGCRTHRTTINRTWCKCPILRNEEKYHRMAGPGHCIKMHDMYLFVAYLMAKSGRLFAAASRHGRGTKRRGNV